MKKIRLIGLFIILFSLFGFSLNVNASEKYTITTEDVYSDYGVTNFQYNTYDSDGNFLGYTYCFSPGKPTGSIDFAAKNTRYEETDTIEPGSSYVDLALSYAYSLVRDSNKITASGKESGEIISILFRFILSSYNLLDTGGPDQYMVDAYRIKNGYQLAHPERWNMSNPDMKFIMETFKEVITKIGAFKKKNISPEKAYETLQKNDKMFKEKFGFELVSKEKIDGKDTHLRVTIKIKPENMSKSVIDWNGMTVSCDYGYVCNKESVDPDKKTITVRISTKNVTEKNKKKAEKAKVKYGLTISSTYTNNKNVENRLSFLESVQSPEGLQKMLKIDGTPKPYDFSVQVWFEEDEDEPEPERSCVCEQDENEKYTGKFLLKTKDEEGNEEEETIEFDDSRAEEYECPDPESCKYSCDEVEDDNGKKTYYDKEGKETTKVKYQLECEPGNFCEVLTDDDGSQTYIGKDGKEVTKDQYVDECLHICEIIYDDSGKPTYMGKDGKETNRETYRKECLHICEPPSAENGNQYYCSEIGEDKGGQVCTQEDYEEECECPVLKETCEGNPDDPSCEEYDSKCPSCNASVSMPDTCNDFDKESELVGTVSDINQEESSCNSDVNPVKKCVLYGSDQAGESFEATTEVKNNEYCKVWCDESYEFTVPTARYSLSGGYFKLSAKISGTRNCYVSGKGKDKGLDYEAFEKEIEGLNQSLYSSWTNWSKWKALRETGQVKASGPTYGPDGEKITKTITWSYQGYDSEGTLGTYTDSISDDAIYTAELNTAIVQASSEFSSLNQKIKSKIEAYDVCTKGWNNDMKFDPEIEYDYHEEEYMKISTGKFSSIGGDGGGTENTYCLGDTDDQYNCLGQAVTTSDDSVPNEIYKENLYVVCNTSGCNKKKYLLSKAKWIQKTKKNSATLVPNQQFSTYHQYGTVKTGAICGEGGYNNCLWTRLPDEALPVELKTGKGAFPFVLKFNNIGQSNSTGELGRLVNSSGSKSVLSEYNGLSSDKQCTYNQNDSGPSQVGTLKQEVGYVCAYINNCPECDVTCSEDDCELTEKCDGECPIECKNCIFDGENTRYKFRPISVNNVFPNSCEDTTDNCREKGYNWKTLKAQVTEKEIEEKGEQIYEQAEYSYILSPAQMKEIRDYNREVGVYTNTTLPDGSNALQCDQIELDEVMISVRCKSTFLNDKSERYFTEVTRNDTFTLWQESNYCAGSDCKMDRMEGIGPSWK